MFGLPGYSDKALVIDSPSLVPEFTGEIADLGENVGSASDIAKLAQHKD